jgi:cytochrome c oxidase subunit I+III
MLFLMTLFSYLYLFGVQPDFWQDPPELLTAAPVLALYAGAAGFALLGRRLLAREKSTLWSPSTASIVGALLLLPALAADYLSVTARLNPELSGQGAVAHAFLANQLMLCTVAALMAAFLAGRTSRKLITRPRNNTVDLATIFVVYTAAQGAAGALIVRLVTGAG